MMAKKIQRIKSGLLALVFGLSMMIAMPVSVVEAADVSDSARGVVGINCKHPLCKLYTTNLTDSRDYCVSTGDEGHDLMLDETFTCSRGHDTVVTSKLGTEWHTWSRTRWDSLDHRLIDGITAQHVYRIYCTGCGYSRTVTLLCDYETKGYHTTPF